MPGPQQIEYEASIVVVGSFNPAIFHPEWLVKNELIPSVEGENVSEVKLIHNDLCSFQLNWAEFEITSKRFQIKCHDTSKFGPLRDLAIGIFAILSQTPVKQLGINSKLRFLFSDEDAWHAFGDVLVPKKIWENALHGRVGLLKLTVKSEREDDLDGYINVSVSGEADRVVLFDVNNHVELNDGGINLLSEILGNSWDTFQDKAVQIARETLEGAS